ncbi:hypothetical protein DL96DRAFT_1600240 [Flagelloscypha sp. PMI_526]|nr:hypothetical protein DL96DRAFT_1600240 [Flagelloscypha sp. PMI_526]
MASHQPSFGLSLPKLPFSPASTVTGNMAPCHVHDIRQAVQTAELGLKSLDKLAAQINEARSSHLTFILHHRKLLSSACVLPQDVWREIFQWVCVGNELDVWKRTSLWDRRPLTLSHVSRELRQIAIQLHSIWNNIRIDPYHDIKPGIIPLLELYLARSRLLPLHISMITGCDVDDRTWFELPHGACNILSNSFSLLAFHSRRWKTVKFHLPHTVLSAFLPLRTPILASADIKVWEPSRTVIGPILFADATELNSLTLCNFLPKTSISVLAPITSLRFIRLEKTTDNYFAFSVSNALDVMVACGALEEAYLRLEAPLNGYSTERDIEHSTLRKLVLSSNRVSNFLEHLTAKNLVEFKVRNATATDALAFSAFLSRCPSLQILTLDRGCNPTVLRSIHSPPNLSRLSIIFVHSDVSVCVDALQVLADTSAPVPIFPSLSRFTLRLGPDAACSEDSVRLRQAITALAQTRLASTGLRSATIQNIVLEMSPQRIPSIVLDRFSHLNHLGLDGLELVERIYSDLAWKWLTWPVDSEED